jgi:hypothetical protein
MPKLLICWIGQTQALNDIKNMFSTFLGRHKDHTSNFQLEFQPIPLVSAKETMALRNVEPQETSLVRNGNERS